MKKIFKKAKRITMEIVSAATLAFAAACCLVAVGVVVEKIGGVVCGK